MRVTPLGRASACIQNSSQRWGGLNTVARLHKSINVDVSCKGFAFRKERASYSLSSAASFSGDAGVETLATSFSKHKRQSTTVEGLRCGVWMQDRLSSPGVGYWKLQERLMRSASIRPESVSSRSSLLRRAIGSGTTANSTQDSEFGREEGASRVESNGDASEIFWSDPERPRICILGGGFGGLYTALRLESLLWPTGKRPQILLVDQAERFVFKPMLYEVLSKEADIWEVAPRFQDLLSGTEVKFVQDTVKSVSPADGGSSGAGLAEAGHVVLGSGKRLSYDWLVLALGAESRLTLVPGAKETALPFSTLQDALEAEARLKRLERERFGPDKPPIKVTIVGAGYSGIELASTVSQRLGSRGEVTVVDPADVVCPSAPPGNREIAKKVLASRNVSVVLGYAVSSIESKSSSGAGILTLRAMDASSARGGESGAVDGGEKKIEADLILWTVGNKPSVPPGPEEGSAAQTFPLTGRGQADTDETLRVRNHPRVFALGDSAATRDKGVQLPATAQVAFQQADYVGWNLWAAINNRPLLPFRYQHLGEMMTLGTSDAAVSIGFLDNFTLEGPLAHTARKLAYLYRMPTNEHRAKVGLSWLFKAAIDSVAMVQKNVLSAARQ